MTKQSCGRIVICDGDEDAGAALELRFLAAGYDVGLFACGSSALADAVRERPDAVVIDVDIADISGYALCTELRDRFGPTLPIVFVSADRTEARDRVAGLLLGADDYLTKPVLGEEIVLRIRRLLELAPPPLPARGELTSRELEILALLASGLDETAIANRLVISSKTVATHIQRILPKLGVHSRAQAVARAYREGLLGGSTAGD